MGEAVRMGEIRNAYKILIGKLAQKRSLSRPLHRLDNIKMDLGEIHVEGVDWIHLPQDKSWRLTLMNTVMNLQVL
jgi:hypothetical protein